MTILDTLNSTTSWLDKNKAGALAFGGCACFIGATITGIASTPSAMECIADYKEGNKKVKDLATMVGEFALLYSGAIALTAAGCCFINSSCKTYQTQIATATAAAAAATQAYQMTKKELDNYREAVKSEVGEKKEKKIHDKMVTEDAKKDPPKSLGPAPGPDDGKIWCKFYQTGVWFKASLDDVYKAEKHLADRFGFRGCEAWVSYNDVYRELDIDVTPTGDYYGWDCENGIEWSYSWGQFDNGERYLVIDWDYQIDEKIGAVTNGFTPMASE